MASADLTRNKAAAAPQRAAAAGPPLRYRLRRAMPQGRPASRSRSRSSLVLFGPVLLLALFSFNDSSIISLPWSGFTTHWYDVAWSDAEAREAVIHSLIVAVVVMVLSVVLGTMAAWGHDPAALPRPRRRRRPARRRSSSSPGCWSASPG